MSLRFEALSATGNGLVILDDPVLVLAGFTGRDTRTVEEHIAELNELGVAAPSTVPALYVLPNWLLQVDTTGVQVGGAETSGEVEPVLVRLADGTLYVTVGSDHTDRALERVSFGASKLACPKTVCGKLWRLDEIGADWDRLRLESYTGRGMEPYQSAMTGELLAPEDLLAIVDERVTAPRSLVLFMGTVSLRSAGFRFSERFTARIVRDSETLESSYDIEVVDPLDASLAGLFTLGEAAQG